MKQLEKWHQTKLGLLIFGLTELISAYSLASLAIDRGSFLYYLLTLVFLIGGLRNLFKLIGKLMHHEHKTD